MFRGGPHYPPGLQYVWSKDDVGGHPPGHTWLATADSPLLCFLVRGALQGEGHAVISWPHASEPVDSASGS